MEASFQHAMLVYIHIREKQIPIQVGKGEQTLKWLADVSMISCEGERGWIDQGVPARAQLSTGKLLDLKLSIASQILDGEHVHVTLSGRPLPTANA